MVYFVAVDIGCIECGEYSSVIGIFSDQWSAKIALEKAAELQKENWHGQHEFQVFLVNELNESVIPNYRGY